jgi:hypothetical protein
MSNPGNPQAQAHSENMRENIQRTVERAALRKVRKLTDLLEGEQRESSRLEGRALKAIWVVAAISVVLVALLTAVAFERSQPQTADIQLPIKTMQPAKP